MAIETGIWLSAIALVICLGIGAWIKWGPR